MHANSQQMIKRKGMTLIEVLVVMIIIVVLAAFTIPNFGGRKEDTLDNEAFGVLKQMNAAEKFYYLEMDNYYPSSGDESDISTINQNLKLADITENNWDYLCNDTGCAQATRVGADSRIWHMEITHGDPVSGACP